MVAQKEEEEEEGRVTTTFTSAGLVNRGTSGVSPCLSPLLLRSIRGGQLKGMGRGITRRPMNAFARKKQESKRVLIVKSVNYCCVQVVTNWRKNGWMNMSFCLNTKISCEALQRFVGFLL